MPRPLAILLRAPGARCAVVALAAVAAGVAPGTARGDAAPAGASSIATYALIVGSNQGGPGQTALHYAEADARRVAGTLIELGGYPIDAVDVVLHPTPDALRSHLDKLAARVAADRAAGRQARVLFYYSGHARSTAIDLGAEPLELGDLRQRLFAIPATLTVVVLDACQSGAFSRLKGAQPAADFSFNSRQHLDASGIAVLASSSGSELSQESEQLQSSYFTYHLLIGLRGAGDVDGDGQVSINEAYRYAYHQTLLATAETAVGGQHVSLEVELKGHGDVPLSFPRAASGAIELPAALEGQTVVESRRSHGVVAETYKARGAAVRIAVAPGDYQVVIRRAGTVSRCAVTVAADAAAAPIATERCASESIAVATAKGGGVRPALRVALSGTTGGEHRDGFTDTLAAFGYKRDGGLATGLALDATRQVDRRLWLGGFAAVAGAPRWTLATERQPLRFAWTTAALGALARAVQPFGSDGLAGRSGLYAQLGAGLGYGRTTFRDQDDRATAEQFLGWAMTLGSGLYLDRRSGVGFALGYAYDYAPVIDNLTGDTHASGGHRLTASVSYTY
jgi:hypothetical protein